MAVPRSKKTKQKTYTIAEVRRFTITANKVCLAIAARCMMTCFDYKPKQVGEFIGAYLALLDEVVDKRNSPAGLVEDTKELTGVDISKLIDDAYEGRL